MNAKDFVEIQCTAGFTNKQTADRLRISKSLVEKYKSGKQKISSRVENAMLVLKALNEDGSLVTMRAGENKAIVERLQEIIDPVATTETDKLLRALWGYFDTVEVRLAAAEAAAKAAMASDAKEFE